MKLEIEVQSQIEFRQLFYSLLVSHLGFTDEGIKTWVSFWNVEKPDEFDPGTWVYTPRYQSSRVFYSGSEYYWFPANDNNGYLDLRPYGYQGELLGRMPTFVVTGYWEILDLPDPAEWSTEPVLFTAFISSVNDPPLEVGPELFFDTHGHLKCYVYGFETGLHFIFRNSRNEAYYFSFMKPLSVGQYDVPALLTMTETSEFESAGYIITDIDPDNPSAGIGYISDADPFTKSYANDTFGYGLIETAIKTHSPSSFVNPNFQPYFSGSLVENSGYYSNVLIGQTPCCCIFEPTGDFVNFSVLNNVLMVHFGLSSYLGFYE